MQDAKTGGSRWVPDIREDEITEFQEQNGDETATYKAVNVHPIISRVLDKLAFFRTHVSAVWYNKLANKTVKDKLDEIDTSISSLNSNFNLRLNNPNQISDIFAFAESCENGLHFFVTGSATTNIPAEATTWRYSPGLVLKRTNNNIAVLLFAYNTNQIAITTMIESGWNDWTIK